MRKTYYFCYSDLAPEVEGVPHELYAPAETEEDMSATMDRVARQYRGWYARIVMTPERAIDPIVMVGCATRTRLTIERIGEIDAAIAERMLESGLLNVGQVQFGGDTEYEVEMADYTGSNR